MLKPYKAMIAEAVAARSRASGALGWRRLLRPHHNLCLPNFPPAPTRAPRWPAAPYARVVEAARLLMAQGCSVIALSQFSMARALGS